MRVRFAVLLSLVLLLSGCAGSPGQPSQGDSTGPEGAAGSGPSLGDGGTGPSAAMAGGAAGLPEEWFLNYSGSEQACLEQDGRLVDARPGERACWHLPGLVLDEPRTFAGQARGAWPKGTAVEGVLVLFGQSASPSTLTLTLRAAGTVLGSFDVDAVLLPFTETEVPFSFATAAPAAAGDALEFEVAYRLPTATDYLVTGESGFAFLPS